MNTLTLCWPKALSNIVSYVKVFCLVVVAYCLAASSISSAQQVPRQNRAATPFKEITRQLEAMKYIGIWKTLKVDEQPSVLVEGYRGYRLILRRTWKHYTDTPQQQRTIPNVDYGPFELRHADWEFVLFPVQPKKATAEWKSKIKWQKSNSPTTLATFGWARGMGILGLRMARSLVRNYFVKS